MNMIAMTDKEGCIGANGDQVVHLWHDLNRFKRYTENKVVICGSNTIKTFPKHSPLKNRSTVILSKNLNKNDYITFPDRNITIMNDIRDVVMLPTYVDTNDIWVIGGASIYRQLINFVDYIIITEVDTVFTGENKLYFPSAINYDFTKVSSVMVNDYDRTTNIDYKTFVNEYHRINHREVD